MIEEEQCIDEYGEELAFESENDSDDSSSNADTKDADSATNQESSEVQ